MRREWTPLEISYCGVIRSDHAGARARFNGHVAYRHAPFHGKAAYRAASEFNRITGAACRANLADHCQRDVLGGDAFAQRAVDNHVHRFGLFYQQTLSRQDVLDF